MDISFSKIKENKCKKLILQILKKQLNKFLHTFREPIGFFYIFIRYKNQFLNLKHS